MFPIQVIALADEELTTCARMAYQTKAEARAFLR